MSVTITIDDATAADLRKQLCGSAPPPPHDTPDGTMIPPAAEIVLSSGPAAGRWTLDPSGLPLLNGTPAPGAGRGKQLKQVNPTVQLLGPDDNWYGYEGNGVWKLVSVTPPPPTGQILPASLTWGQGRMLPDAYGGSFIANATIVASLPVPSNGQGMWAGCAEWQGPPTYRQITISRTQADFRPVDPTGINGPIAMGQGNNAGVGAAVGTGPGMMQPGATYYINVRNYSPDIGGCSCFQTACNMALDFQWSTGGPFA